MSSTYGAMEVIFKPTGEKRLIKFDRFDPEIHKKIGDPFTMNDRLDYDKPVHIQSDALAAAVLRAEEKKKNSLENVPAIEEDQVREEVSFDPSKDLSKEELEKLSFKDVKAYAKHRGVLCPFGTSRKTLLTQVVGLSNS